MGLPPLPPLVHKSVVGLPVVSAGVAVTRDSSVVVPFRDHRGKRKREGGGDVKSSRSGELHLWNEQLGVAFYGSRERKKEQLNPRPCSPTTSPLPILPSLSVRYSRVLRRYCDPTDVKSRLAFTASRRAGMEVVLE